MAGAASSRPSEVTSHQVAQIESPVRVLGHFDLGDVLLRIGTSSSPRPSGGEGGASESRRAGSEGSSCDPDGPLTAARKAYERAFDIAQKLAAADPTDARAQRDLSISYNDLGDVQLQSGQVTEALRSYEKGLEIRQKLAAADPTDAQAQTDLHISYDRMGRIEQSRKQYQAAIGWYEKSKSVLETLQADNKLPSAHRPCGRT